MIIRIAVGADLGAVHTIYSDAHVARWLGREPMALDEFRALFDDLCARPQFAVWELDARVVGFHHLSRLSSKAGSSAYLSTVALVPEYQGQGLARTLLERVMDDLRREGVDRIDLIVDSENQAAIGCYQRLGFVIERTLSRCAQRNGAMRTVADHYMGVRLRSDAQ